MGSNRFAAVVCGCPGMQYYLFPAQTDGKHGCLIDQTHRLPGSHCLTINLGPWRDGDRLIKREDRPIFIALPM